MHALALFRKAAVLPLLIVASCSALAQTTSANKAGAEHIGLPIDWSQRHVVYTKDDPAGLAAAVKKDPRYFYSWQKRHGADLAAANASGLLAPKDKKPKKHGVQTNIDWSFPLGTAFVVGSPAKWSFDINATPSCTNDYVAYPLGSSGPQANLLILNNLYSGPAAAPNGFCKDALNAPLAGPTVDWSYKITDAGSFTQLATSPSLSLDGTKIAFTTSGTNFMQWLHVLTLKPGGEGTSLASPSAPDHVVASAPVAQCSSFPGASCDLQIPISTNTLSSPYVDYTNDVAYITTTGSLYKVSCVFHCITYPTVSNLFTFSAAVGGKPVDPLLDFNNKTVYFGDGDQLFYGFNVQSSANTVQFLGTVSAQPILDSTNGTIFVFSGLDLANNYSEYQLDLDLNILSSITIGRQPGVGSPFYGDYAGALDDLYYNLGPSAGHLYHCGLDASFRPMLFRMRFFSGILDVPDQQILLGPSPADCYGLTEIKNTNSGTDWLFLFNPSNLCFDPSTASLARCVQSFDLSQPLSVGPASQRPVYGTQSPIVVDNVADPAQFPQASSIYFVSGSGGTCSAGSCAIKLTQQNLQ